MNESSSMKSSVQVFNIDCLKLDEDLESTVNNNNTKDDLYDNLSII